jgi:hypothetical protein
MSLALSDYLHPPTITVLRVLKKILRIRDNEINRGARSQVILMIKKVIKYPMKW